MSKTQINLIQLMPFGTSMSALLGFASLFLKSIIMEVKMQINIIEMLAGFGYARSLVTTQEHRSRIEDHQVSGLAPLGRFDSSKPDALLSLPWSYHLKGNFK